MGPGQANRTVDRRLNRRRFANLEDELFDEFMTVLRTRRIVRDGAMPAYAAQPQRQRLMFVLKEANDPKGTWAGDLRAAPTWDFHDHNYRRATWDQMLRWTGVVLENQRLGTIIEGDWHRLMPRIAVVNLCKKPGGSIADPRRIDAILANSRYRTLLRRQLELYSPCVTVCGGAGVFDWLARVMEWNREHYERIRCRTTTDHICFVRSADLGLVIDFWHPARSRRTNNDLMRILDEVVQRLGATG